MSRDFRVGPETLISQEDAFDFPKSIEKERTETKIAFTVGTSTEAALKHPERNEDRTVIRKNANALALFDGASNPDRGGHGEDAAIVASEGILKRLNPSANNVEAVAHLKRILLEVNDEVIQTNGFTTASVVQFTEQEGRYYLNFINAADSRIYIYREGVGLVCITLDDRPLKTTEEEKAILLEKQKRRDNLYRPQDASDVAYFKFRSAVYGPLGQSSEEVRADHGSYYIEPGDLVIMTSDGIHDNLTFEEIQSLLNQRLSVEELSRRLVSASRSRSKEPKTKDQFRPKDDDLTAVVCRLEGKFVNINFASARSIEELKKMLYYHGSEEFVKGDKQSYSAQVLAKSIELLEEKMISIDQLPIVNGYTEKVKELLGI